VVNTFPPLSLFPPKAGKEVKGLSDKLKAYSDCPEAIEALLNDKVVALAKRCEVGAKGIRL